MIYRSKIDLWLLLVVFIPLSIPLWIGIRENSFDFLLIELPIIAFIVYLFLETKYRITGTVLNVKAGFLINEDIDIKTIKSIKKTYNPISSPALSINRLAISYEDSGYILISPKKRKKFIAHLLEINPNIYVKV